MENVPIYVYIPKGLGSLLHSTSVVLTVTLLCLPVELRLGLGVSVSHLNTRPLLVNVGARLKPRAKPPIIWKRLRKR